VTFLSVLIKGKHMKIKKEDIQGFIHQLRVGDIVLLYKYRRYFQPTIVTDIQSDIDGNKLFIADGITFTEELCWAVNSLGSVEVYPPDTIL
jgi:hypothetical protein